MRSFLLAIFTTAAIVSATSCAQNDIQELVSRTDCGCSKSISECLSADVDLQRLGEIEKCFVGGGCSEAEAAVGAVWFAHECHEEKAADEQEELKKRADSSTTDAKTTGKTEAKTTEQSTTTAPSSVDASTTSDLSTSTEPSAAASSTTATSATTTSDTSTTSSTDSTTSTTSTTSATSTSTGTQTTPL